RIADANTFFSSQKEGSFTDENNGIYEEESSNAQIFPIDKNAVKEEIPYDHELKIVEKNEEIIAPKKERISFGKENPETGLTLEVKNTEVLNDKKDEESVVIKPKIQQEPYDPILDLRNYKYPTLDLLENHGSDKIIQDVSELEENKNQIIHTLRNYDIEIQKIFATVGPTVTLYEIIPAPGVRISRIKNLEDDIALSLSALGIRIIAPIPGKGTIGIEVPNFKKTVVSMKTLLNSDKFQNNKFSLPIAIGKKIDNENFIVDLTSMPHLLMAGATGQGKSVGLNAILVSLLYKKHPSQLKLVLIDPKKVELSIYKTIEKHFLAKLPGEEDAIITDTKKVIHTLNALCIEMDNRYDLLKEAGTRNIKEYNQKFVARKLNPEKGHQFLPFIVLVIDEFADLIMTAGKEVEMPIARLAQLARAVGIHLIIATQRPSVNIITGTIKANFPARIAFKVSSKIDSRTILDIGGAEQLIGKGDMLISYNGELTRLQCAFVDTPEVDKITDFIGDQQGYSEAFMLPEYIDEKEFENKTFDASDRDPLFEDAAKLIVQSQSGSTSLLQRRMKLGYNRAGRLMDQLEAAGIVGPNQGSKVRDVMVKTDAELQEYLNVN
ncbi:MAG: DNA translocase FtsK, partial [Ginsengibacter sp.]